ncbi:MAG: ATP-binding cassette domain-containing protein, partial [Planctomycetota bacterium]
MNEASQMPATALVTEQLTRYFDQQCAVDGINLRVEAGTFYGFLGPNGAGKSTTIKMLTGLLQPNAGSIRILGRDVAIPSDVLEIKRRIGVVPENLALFDNLTATEHLTFVGRMFQLDAETIRQRSRELLELMKLDREHRKLTLEYSHG